MAHDKKKPQKDRILTGTDLVMFRDRHGFTHETVCELLGLTRQTYKKLIDSGPIPNQDVRMLLRYYMENPDKVPLTGLATMEDAFEAINAELGKTDPDSCLNKKEFAALFGNRPTASIRWLNYGRSASRPIQNLLYLAFKEENPGAILLSLGGREQRLQEKLGPKGKLSKDNDAT